MGHHQHQTLSQRYVKCFLYRRYTGKIAAPRGDLGLKVLEKPSCCIAELLPDVTQYRPVKPFLATPLEVGVRECSVVMVNLPGTG